MLASVNTGEGVMVDGSGVESLPPPQAEINIDKLINNKTEYKIVVFFMAPPRENIMSFFNTMKYNILSFFIRVKN